MKLSILIPMYNASRYIGNCLESLINQDIPKNEYEIIVLNDGSTDNSPELVNELINANSNIKMFSHSNIGLGATRNIGIKLAKGKYIYFIDSDDYLAYNTLGFVLATAIESSLDIVGFKTLETDKLDLYSSNTPNILSNNTILKGSDFLSTYRNHRLEAWWYIMNTNFLLQSNLKYEEKVYMEDAVFTFKIFLEVKRAMFLPLDIHRYVKTPHSIMNNENQEHLLKIIYDYVDLAFRFKELCDEILKKNINNSYQIINNVQHKSTVSIYFMFFKIIKSKLTLKEINFYINKLKAMGSYPMKGFVGENYNTLKFRLTFHIFNNKYLFYSLLYPFRMLYRFKLIRIY